MRTHGEGLVGRAISEDRFDNGSDNEYEDIACPAQNHLFSKDQAPCDLSGYVARLIVLKVELITPAGDPVNAAVQSGDGQNEFTYSTASPGVLTMNLKAKVTPSGVANQIKDQCLFTVDAIAGSTLAWDTANPGGKPTASGDDLLATVTFTGLPANNSDFGAKKAFGLLQQQQAR